VALHEWFRDLEDIRDYFLHKDLMAEDEHLQIWTCRLVPNIRELVVDSLREMDAMMLVI
jgi:hypothetical protein